MSKTTPPVDVLVLGEHPSAYLAVELLLAKPALNVVHCTIPHERIPDRLVLINPELFTLHKPLDKMRKKLDLCGVWGVDFLCDDGTTCGQYRSKTLAAVVTSYAQLRKAVCQLAKDSGAKLLAPKTLAIHRVDETGFEVTADNQTLRPKVVLLAGALNKEQSRVLALPEMFPAEVMRRYAFLRLKGQKWADPNPKPIVQMSLDLAGKLTWAWMLTAGDEIQLAVELPLVSPIGQEHLTPAKLLRHWAATLAKHKALKTTEGISDADIQQIEIPSAGALSREIVGNRTLLFGPAAGFYTACLEDIYPNCWSAVFAVEAVRAALAQPHLQDALQPYREKWGTTLGEYLRGPQENLRFLLPLVYRNPVMTARMAESILLGKSVVR